MASEDLKIQRDRFLAFSFSSADLLLEVAENGDIVYALGAGKTLTGVDADSLLKKNWLDLFREKDKVPLAAMKKSASDGKRTGPICIQLNSTLTDGREGLVMGIKMPNNNHFYVTVGFASELMSRLIDLEEPPVDEYERPVETFSKNLTKAIQASKDKGIETDFTLFNIGEADDIKLKLGDTVWDQFTDAISDILQSQSIDGSSASQISDGQFGILHDKNKTTSFLEDQISEFTKEADLDVDGLEFAGKSVDTDIATLTEKEASRALLYTMREFEKQGSDLNINTLNGGFKDFLNENSKRISSLKNTIERLNFDLYFQPIIDVKTANVSHFEMLARFQMEEAIDTHDVITFGEDIGMAADVDLAICKRALNYLTFNANTNKFKFAINLSGQSIQNDAFFENLLLQLDEQKKLSDRILFEITESSEIGELNNVNKKILKLQEKGFKVCLDDFGAGAASIQYLHKLHVDYLKIDGKYTSSITTSKRDHYLIKNIVSLCNDLHVKCVAERIENINELKVLDELGVHYGQGYLFGAPKSRPEFKQPVSMVQWMEERQLK